VTASAVVVDVGATDVPRRHRQSRTGYPLRRVSTDGHAETAGRALVRSTVLAGPLRCCPRHDRWTGVLKIAWRVLASVVDRKTMGWCEYRIHSGRMSRCTFASGRDRRPEPPGPGFMVKRSELRFRGLHRLVGMWSQPAEPGSASTRPSVPSSPGASYPVHEGAEETTRPVARREPRCMTTHPCPSLPAVGEFSIGVHVVLTNGIRSWRRADTATP